MQAASAAGRSSCGAGPLSSPPRCAGSSVKSRCRPPSISTSWRSVPGIERAVAVRDMCLTSACARRAGAPSGRPRKPVGGNYAARRRQSSVHAATPSSRRSSRKNSLGACRFSSAVENENSSVFSAEDPLEEHRRRQRAADADEQRLPVGVHSVAAHCAQRRRPDGRRRSRRRAPPGLRLDRRRRRPAGTRLPTCAAIAARTRAGLLAGHEPAGDVGAGLARDHRERAAAARARSPRASGAPRAARASSSRARRAARARRPRAGRPPRRTGRARAPRGRPAPSGVDVVVEAGARRRRRPASCRLATIRGERVVRVLDGAAVAARVQVARRRR